ncbi:MAG TPA: co-chaperone GroES [Candidatus Omnitrophota bacterium]|jgi:chaperonin GroES|nr:co-chaperone GroES [Candidatus Omnitrophota bacterium]MDD5737144.1 co-chaperone GroES [Candidatus Omnitrophota bacterium]HOX10235.1 co-chaperone GroES [Candidatus Omnitrophota bacterium]HRZ67391.1 co-chaperone GroES [Candidatus Omnitrophota bacterium]
MNLKPLGDKVIVEVLSAEEKTKGGIILPDTAKEKPQEAKVIAVGSGKVLDNGKTVAPDVKAGDIIIFGKYSGSEVKVDGKEYLIIDADDILAIVK